MRKISKTHYNRLVAQAKEADFLGLDVAQNLDSLLNRVELRPEGPYLYTRASLNEDVSNALWDAATRVSDYLGTVPDSRSVQDLINIYAAKLVDELTVVANHKSGIGPFEPAVPGESYFQPIEVYEDDDQ